MKFLRTAFTFILILSLAGCNATASADITKGVLTSLSDENYQGRLTGSKENIDAGSYLIGIYKDIGLQPLVEKGYLWTYDQKTYDPELSNPEITLIYSDGKREKLVPGEDFFFNVACGDINETFSVAKKASELTDSNKIFMACNVNDIQGLKSEPKVIFKKENLLTLSTGELHSGNIMVSIKANIFDKIIESSIKNIGIFNKNSEKTTQDSNIIGYIPGENHKKAVILSAHFDAAGKFGETYSSGAYDNASGVAVMLSIANELRRDKLKSDIVFCAFNGEEQGLKGSKAAVAKLKTIYPEMYNINIDCLGVKDCGDISLGNQGEAYNEQLITDIKKSLKKHGIPYNDDLSPTSDQQSFNIEFIPNISVGQGKLIGIIHSKNDKVDKIDLNQLELVKNAIVDFIRLNNGKSYMVKGNGNYFDNEALMEACSNKAGELRESLKLEFDEGYTFKMLDVYVSTTGNRPITDMALLRQYYPNFNIPSKFSSCTLERVIFNGEELLQGLNPTGVGMDSPERKLDSRYKIDISKIDSAIFDYFGDNDREISIVIHKAPTARDESMSYKKLGPDLGNYELFGEPKSEKYYGFIYADELIDVKITFGQRTNEGLMMLKAQDDKTIIKLIKDIGIEKSLNEFERILGISS